MLPASFAERHLTVAPRFVDPPESARPRIEREAVRLRAIYDTVSTTRPPGLFVPPVPHPRSSPFGSRSVFNGQPRDRHAGLDFASPAGAVIRAPAAGRVALVAPLYFTGNTVVLDHGYGVHSILAHMQRTSVRAGQVVARGARLGTVGATGRATAAHLHWSVRVGATRVDPASVLDVLAAPPNRGRRAERPGRSVAARCYPRWLQQEERRMSQDDVREVPLRYGPIDAGATIGHVHLKVADLERALDFYCGILGFELVQRYGTSAAFISAGGYHHHIGLNTWESHGAPPPPTHTTGLYHVAIKYPKRAALADALRRLIASGIPLDGASDHGVSEALYLRDPDDNGVELYWDRPEAAWPRTANGRAGDVYAAAERAGAARGPRRPAGGATGRGPRPSRSPRLASVAKAAGQACARGRTIR